MSATADLLLELSCRPVSVVDPLVFLAEAALGVAGTLGVRGAVLVVPATGWVRGSDDTATLVGAIQWRDGQGPVATVARTGRPALTADLTRVGPPPLAALADEGGLTCSVAVALSVGTQLVAVLQLLGRPGRPVGQADVEALGDVPAVLAARIADLVALTWRSRSDIPLTPPPVLIPSQPPAPREESVADGTMALPTTPPRPAAPRTEMIPVQAIRVADVSLPADQPVSLRSERMVQDPLTAVHAGALAVVVPLRAATPELVTEELRAVGRAVLRLARPRSRHRQAEG